MSEMYISEWGFVRVGFCPIGLCPMGFCPSVVLSWIHYEHARPCLGQFSFFVFDRSNQSDLVWGRQSEFPSYTGIVNDHTRVQFGK